MLRLRKLGTGEQRLLVVSGHVREFSTHWWVNGPWLCPRRESCVLCESMRARPTTWFAAVVNDDKFPSLVELPTNTFRSFRLLDEALVDNVFSIYRGSKQRSWQHAGFARQVGRAHLHRVPTEVIDDCFLRLWKIPEVPDGSLLIEHVRRVAAMRIINQLGCHKTGQSALGNGMIGGAM